MGKEYKELTIEELERVREDTQVAISAATESFRAAGKVLDKKRQLLELEGQKGDLVKLKAEIEAKLALLEE